MNKKDFNAKLLDLQTPNLHDKHNQQRDLFILNAWLCEGKNITEIADNDKSNDKSQETSNIDLGVDRSTISRAIKRLCAYFEVKDKPPLVSLFLEYAPEFVHRIRFDEVSDSKQQDLLSLIGTKKLYSEKGKVTPQFPENIPSEMRVIINEKLQEGFIGRKFVFEEFELFRKKNRNGYFTIIANPGMGKSTIAAQYVMEQSVTDDVGCVAFFIVSGGCDRPEACIQSICEQLKLTYKLDVDISRIAKGQDVITSVFSEVLQEVSDRHLSSENLVIVIDALDELSSQGNNRGNICYLPRYLPENIYFLLTRRNFIAGDERLLTGAGKQNFILGSEDTEDSKGNMEQCEADAREYIEYQLTNGRYQDDLRNRIEQWNINETDFIKILQKKSQANFMYLRYIIPAITEGIYKDISLSGIANGLREYYEDHWRIMNVSEGFGLSVIAVFIIQEEDTSINFISEVLEITVEQVKVIVSKCIQFLDSKALSSSFNILIDKDMRYSFYHKDYRDFLQEEKMNGSILEKTRKILAIDNERDGLDEFFDN